MEEPCLHADSIEINGLRNLASNGLRLTLSLFAPLNRFPWPSEQASAAEITTIDGQILPISPADPYEVTHCQGPGRCA